MPPADLTLDRLFRVLPRTAELAPLREALLAASRPDASRHWSGSAAYATIDQRVLRAEMLDSVFAAAEARSLAHVRTHHAALRLALHSLAEGRSAESLRGLAQLGELAHEQARWEESISYYAVVVELAAELGITDLLVLAARRLGRAHHLLGHFALSLQWYQRSLREAGLAGDAAGVATAHTGIGHVHALQGRMPKAEAAYGEALRSCPVTDPRLRAQLHINTSMTAREMGRVEEAGQHLEQARLEWDQLSPGDRSGWYNNSGLLLLREGRLAAARPEFEQALALSTSHADSAMILDNLAELALREGRLGEAENCARRAEDFAVGAASARALAEVYMRLGRIMRARGDATGIAFFEKSLDLARVHGDPWVEAHACAEYALLRQEEGDLAEAEGLRARALELFVEFGTDPLPASLRDPA
jgi:tetratricopeptide (TPR) repeat protein